MSVFSNIDNTLERFAANVNGKLTKDRNGFTTKYNDFEERRIDWIKEGINLAIIIQPDIFQEIKRPDRWLFDTVGWRYVGLKRHSKLNLIKRGVPFQEIELELEILLKEGYEYLNNLKFEDLSTSDSRAM